MQSSCSFIKFDVQDFYPSISLVYLAEQLNLEKKYIIYQMMEFPPSCNQVYSVMVSHGLRRGSFAKSTEDSN